MVDLDSNVRPTLDEFTEVFETDPSKGGIADAGLKAYLNAAHDIVAERLGGEGVGEDTLTRIEKFVAADLASAQDPRVKSERVADRRRTYQRVEGESSDYWQIATALDPTGKLAGEKDGVAIFETFGPDRG